MGSRRRFLSRAIAAAGVYVLVAAGCGGSSRPPTLGDIFTSGASGSNLADGSGGTVISTSSSGPPMCNLGPNGGVCACADQPLLIDPPNLYFVLDRSASMNTDGKWATIVNVVGDLIIQLGPRANLGAAVFPDPGGLFPDECTPGIEVFATHRGDSPAGQAGPTSIAFLTTLGHISAAGGTPTAATLQVLAPNLRALPGKTFVILATDGGPNCNPNAVCAASGCQFNIEDVDGCTATGPNCCLPASYVGTNEDCLDSGPTEAAVQALAASGIPVYVVGVPGSAPYAALLDDLATVGQTARGSEPQYYAVDSADQAAFQAALFKIAAKVTSSCTLMLDAVPPDPSLVNVFFDEQAVPQGSGTNTAASEAGTDEAGLDEAGDDEASADADLSADATSADATGSDATDSDAAGLSGWSLNGQTVTLVGATCQKVQNGDVLDVRVVAGCPTVLR